MLRRRKGFVRVAVETGTSIVPVYHFGCNQVGWGKSSRSHQAQRCMMATSNT